MAAAELISMTNVPIVDSSLRLRLYVSGNAPNSRRAIANAKAICAAHCASADALQIVDMLDDPRGALADGIVVSPTLLKLSPQPVARVVGDLSDTTRVLETLSLT
jgi:circadian clock protein KaiB